MKTNLKTLTFAALCVARVLAHAKAMREIDRLIMHCAGSFSTYATVEIA